MILEVIGLLFILYLFNNFYWKRRNLPPGPTPLPILGNGLAFRNNQLEKAFAKWNKQYGDIMTLWFGDIPVIVVNDVPTIFETFLKDGEAYTGRFMSPGFAKLRGGVNGILQTDGELWREHRRFTLQVLRDFGLGKNLMQERVLDEVTSLVSDIKDDLKSGKNIISIQDEIDRAVGSVINVLAFGYRFGRDKEAEFQRNKQNLNIFLKSLTNIVWDLIEGGLTFLKYFPYFKDVYERIKQESDNLSQFYLDQIDTHKKKINLETDDEPTDYVEAFLRQQHKLEKSGQKDHTFTDNQLFGMLFDLWFAGQETTSTTLIWFCIYMIREQEIQKKAHEELDRVVGSDRIITLDDKNELNYINAIIAETQRFCNLIPLNLTHKTTKDVEVHGYKISKGTIIVDQISSVLFDERYFKDPYTFKPERFIDADGKFFSPPELFPFGVGKRACLGEGLARMELYLFAANILNQMRLKPAYGNLPSLEKIFRSTNQPHPFKAEIELRPTPLPLLGNLLSLGNNQMDKAFAKFQKQYGNIWTVWFGNIPIVFLTDAPTIFETFLKDGETYTGRFMAPGFAAIRGGVNGVIMTEGELWRDHRRFTLHVLRNFGLGKNLMQERVLDEVMSLVADIKGDLRNGKNIISIQDEIDRAVGSIINVLTFGYRFGRENEAEFQKNKQNLNVLLSSFTNVAWALMNSGMGFLKKLPYFKTVYERVTKESDDVSHFYLHQVDLHKKKINFEIDDEPADFVEAFLRQRHKFEQSDQKDHTFTDNQLFGMIFDLWFAGQETSSTTLGWLCIYLIRDQEVQKKVHEELDRVIGSDRVITVNDKNELNYVNAVIAETQRFCDLLPQNIPHKITKDVEIHGHKILKDTLVVYQISSVSFDEKYFKDPYTFNPDRFIDENGKFFTPPEFIPFGVGKRACLGEGLARMELFLFTANIFNQMRLKPAYGMLPSLEKIFRSTNQPHPFKAEIELRY